MRDINALRYESYVRIYQYLYRDGVNSRYKVFDSLPLKQTEIIEYLF